MGILLTPRSTVGASVTRMVIYIQTLDVEYVAKSDIDCECKTYLSQAYINISRAVLSTNGVYWCIVEAGFGLTAACLPTLYGLFRTKALESIVRSVRSIVSLGSSPAGSQGSRRSRGLSYKGDASHGSTTSHAEILPSNSQDVELEPLPKANQIRVQKTFDSSDEPTTGHI